MSRVRLSWCGGHVSSAVTARRSPSRAALSGPSPAESDSAPGGIWLPQLWGAVLPQTVLGTQDPHPEIPTRTRVSQGMGRLCALSCRLWGVLCAASFQLEAGRGQDTAPADAVMDGAVTRPAAVSPRVTVIKQPGFFGHTSRRFCRFLLGPLLPETEELLVETPWAACPIRVLSASQGGVCDPSGGGRAPVPVGGEAAVPLQPQDEAPEAPSSRAHGSLRAAAAADDGAALPPVSGAPVGAV